MSEDALFIIDSSSTSQNGPGNHGNAEIVFEQHGVDREKASQAMTESFISVEKDISPHLVVGGGKNKTVDDKSRKLQHDLNVKKQIYFGADINSLLSHSSKNRIRGGGGGGAADSSSPASSKADQLCIASG